MVHLTSSPAKTVWSCQWMKTRMLPLLPSGDMVMLRQPEQMAAGETFIHVIDNGMTGV
jgi:hypothetical protein